MSTAPIGVLLMAYGTPRHPDEVEAYYTDIRRGRPPTADQLADLIRRYEAIGGISPLAERTEAQRDALQAALDAAEPGRYRVILGLKHAEPKIERGVEELAAAGVERIVAIVLAPHYSALSVGQYLDRARAAAEPHGLAVAEVRSWATEPALISFLTTAIEAQLAMLPPATRILFTAHSLPERVLAMGDPYPDELRSTAEAIAARLGLEESTDWSIAWQSAGRTPEPWLGPDVLAVISELADDDHTDGVLVCACGFVADHLEVLYDLDLEASKWATERHLAFARTACVNADPAVLGALAERVRQAAS
jgi:protoporphyrin/coproporphyrin ferrochelatase